MTYETVPAAYLGRNDDKLDLYASVSFVDHCIEVNREQIDRL
jgi:hypothetical protein